MIEIYNTFMVMVVALEFNVHVFTFNVHVFTSIIVITHDTSKIQQKVITNWRGIKRGYFLPTFRRRI